MQETFSFPLLNLRMQRKYFPKDFPLWILRVGLYLMDMGVLFIYLSVLDCFKFNWAAQEHNLWRWDIPSFPFCCLCLCQVIFDETLQKCLDSYLRSAPRKFDELWDCHPEVNELQKCLHRSVFLTFLRMSTHKESKVNVPVPCECSRLCDLGKKRIREMNHFPSHTAVLSLMILSVGSSVGRW